MAKQVTVYTTATNPETGETVNLAPGDTPPDWAKLGDHVFAEPSDVRLTEPVAGPGQAALTKSQVAALQAQLDATEDGVDQTRTSTTKADAGKAKAKA